MNNLNIQLRQINNGYLLQNYSSSYQPVTETFCESLPDVFKAIEEEIALMKNKAAAETALCTVRTEAGC